MTPNEVSSYIQTAREKGASDKSIRQALLQVGWPQEVIDHALSSLSVSLPPPPPPQFSVSNVSSISETNAVSMWDAFEHILMFISLYVMATAIALILHYFVDQWIPPLSTSLTSYGYANDWQTSLVRGYLAALIVSLPIFSFLFLHLIKRTMTHPELRHLQTRKILIYLTLIGTFLFMMFNIITIVYNFLGGNITANFILHFLVTITVNGIIFSYYLFQVQEDRKANG